MSAKKVPYGFVPTQISGCVLWLDGADSSTVTLSSSAITQLNDKSTSANHFVQATTANSPTVGTSANGLPTIYFATTNQQLVSSQNNATSGNASRTVIQVFWCPTSSSGYYSVTGTESGASPPTAWGHCKNPNADIDYPFMYSSAGYDIYTFENSTPNPIITYCQYDSTASTISAYYATSGATNGTTTVGNFTTRSTAFNTTAGVWYLGRRQQAATGSVTSHLLEMIQYNKPLSTTERQNIESYLAQKWSLSSTLSVGHPGLSMTVYNSDYIKNTVPKNFTKPIPYYTAFSPTQIPGCALWLDAADSSTITTVTGVSQWNDKSGNGYNLTQGSTGSQPTRTENLLNFLSNNYLNIPQAAVNNLSTWSIFFVINPISSTNWIMVKQKDGVNTYNVLSMTSNTNSGGGPQTGSTGFLYWRSFNAGSQLASTGAITTSTLQIGNLTYDGTNLYFYKNGVLEKTTAGSFAIPNDTSSTNFTLGVWIQSATIINSGVTNFRLGEMLVYNTGLTTTQQQQVESYLAQKWGLTASLPGGHSHFTQRAGAITTVANTKFSMVGIPRITFASTGLVITHQDGRTWKATANNPGYANYAIGLNSGASMSLNIYAGSDVFNSAGGRVALLYNGDTNNAVRHAGYVMWTSTFAANNYDFAWKFVSSGSGYLIYNDYPSYSAWQVTYDSGADRVLIQPPGAATYGMVWNITPKVTLAYVYSSY